MRPLGPAGRQCCLDIALILERGGRARRHAHYDLAFDVGLAHGVQLAPLVLEVQQFAEVQSPR